MYIATSKGLQWTLNNEVYVLGTGQNKVHNYYKNSIDNKNYNSNIDNYYYNNNNNNNNNSNIDNS